MTKNDARKVVSQSKIAKDLLEAHPNTAKIYQLVNENFNDAQLKNFLDFKK